MSVPINYNRLLSRRFSNPDDLAKELYAIFRTAERQQAERDRKVDAAIDGPAPTQAQRNLRGANEPAPAPAARTREDPRERLRTVALKELAAQGQAPATLGDLDDYIQNQIRALAEALDPDDWMNKRFIKPQDDTGTGSLCGVVTGGAGDTYTVQLYPQGKYGPAGAEVTVRIPQIDPDEIIPPGTWMTDIVKVTRVETQVDTFWNEQQVKITEYWCQVPVWL